METTIKKAREIIPIPNDLPIVLFGTTLIILGASIKIPMYPISFTLHTLAIYLIALTQTPKQAFASVICYLLCATGGLPVLCGHANPLWFFGKSGGYLIAFPIAAYCIAKMKYIQPLTALLCGACIIYALGMLWLIPFFGISIALTKGVLLFNPSEILKMVAALSIIYIRKR